MRNVLPWKGDNYERGLRDGRKVLILGESHYEADGSEEFTRDTVRSLGIEQPYRFFEAIRLTASGLETAPEPADFWHRVAFANAVQDAMPTATDRPTGEQMAAGMRELRGTVAELQPDLLLCYSAFAWDHIHSLDEDGCEPKGWQAAPHVHAIWWIARSGAPPLLAVRVNHPARLVVLRQVWDVWIDKAWDYLLAGPPAAIDGDQPPG